VQSENEATTRDPSVELEHDASGIGIDGVGVGGERLRQLDLDLADMVARNRSVLDA